MRSKINKKVRFIDLGRIDYQEAWDYQESLFQKTIEIKLGNRKLDLKEHSATPNHVIFCQHPHVYTLGKSGTENHLLLNDTGLKQNGASFYRINRGGDITYHGPGQIVGYPILDLENFFTDIHKYLRTLEESVIRTVAEWGIKGTRLEKLTGVWVRNTPVTKDDAPNAYRKICAFGVRTSRWVTMHGLALNVSNDMSYFKHIIPCGILDQGVTSMELELGFKPDLSAVQESLRDNMVELFEMEVLESKPNQ